MDNRESMYKARNLNTILSIWGPKLFVLKIWDKLSGEEKSEIYKYKKLADTSTSNYPQLIKKLYKIYTGENLNLDNPRSYNEKIQWLKLNELTPLKTILADKYLVRGWVEEKIGKEYLIPLIGIWNCFDEIDFDVLPDAFFLKCNHGFGFNYAVKDKKSIDIEKAKYIFDRWMNRNYAYCTFELQYRDIPRKVLAEEYIEQLDGNLFDYKIHVFHGEPRIIQVIGNRDLTKHTAKECFLTPDWVPGELMYRTYEPFETTPEKPENYEEMLRIAGILGEGFRYVRVDLYNLDGQIKFGEMTFTPSSGYGKWNGDEQYLVGSWIDLG